MENYKQVADSNNNVRIDIIQRLSDGAFIPMAEGNKDYREYHKWLSEGNTPLPPDKTE